VNDVILVDLESEDPRWARALPVLRELRPHLTDELFTQVMREAGPQGLRFTAVFAGERCVAIAGWRIVASTSAIRKLYVDDLSTAAADRSRGYGRMLMDELRERAIASGCRSL
jgi:ribosomal protein S18 acetylase RimI-like enzyme